jgi:hypothetical protein
MRPHPLSDLSRKILDSAPTQSFLPVFIQVLRRNTMVDGVRIFIPDGWILIS